MAKKNDKSDKGVDESALDDRVDDLAAELARVGDPLERSLLVCRAVHGLIGGALEDPFAMLGVLEVVKADVGRDVFGMDGDESDADLSDLPPDLGSSDRLPIQRPGRGKKGRGRRS